jgi:hypothetical protein
MYDPYTGARSNRFVDHRTLVFPTSNINAPNYGYGYNWEGTPFLPLIKTNDPDKLYDPFDRRYVADRGSFGRRRRGVQKDRFYQIYSITRPTPPYQPPIIPQYEPNYPPPPMPPVLDIPPPHQPLSIYDYQYPIPPPTIEPPFMPTPILPHPNLPPISPPRNLRRNLDYYRTPPPPSTWNI